MSEILRRISCCLIMLVSIVIFTNSAQSMEEYNLFGKKDIYRESASRADYRGQKWGNRSVTGKEYRRKSAKVRHVRKSYSSVNRKRRYTANNGSSVRVAYKRKTARATRKRHVNRRQYASRNYRKPQRRVYGHRKVAVTRKVVSRKTYRRSKKSHAEKASGKQYAARRGSSRQYASAKVSGNSRFSDLIAKHASTYGVPVNIAHAVVRIESNYHPGVRGGSGEIGLMQIKPSTARAMGFRGSVQALYNPDTNIKYGMKYLAGAYRLSGGTLCGTVLRYNAGHGATRMNPISARYCRKAKQLLGSRSYSVDSPEI